MTRQKNPHSNRFFSYVALSLFVLSVVPAPSLSAETSSSSKRPESSMTGYPEPTSGSLADHQQGAVEHQNMLMQYHRQSVDLAQEAADGKAFYESNGIKNNTDPDSDLIREVQSATRDISETIASQAFQLVGVLNELVLFVEGAAVPIEAAESLSVELNQARETVDAYSHNAQTLMARVEEESRFKDVENAQETVLELMEVERMIVSNLSNRVLNLEEKTYKTIQRNEIQEPNPERVTPSVENAIKQIGSLIQRTQAVSPVPMHLRQLPLRDRVKTFETIEKKGMGQAEIEIMMITDMERKMEPVEDGKDHNSDGLAEENI